MPVGRKQSPQPLPHLQDSSPRARVWSTSSGVVLLTTRVVGPRRTLTTKHKDLPPRPYVPCLLCFVGKEPETDLNRRVQKRTNVFSQYKDQSVWESTESPYSRGGFDFTLTLKTLRIHWNSSFRSHQWGDHKSRTPPTLTGGRDPTPLDFIVQDLSIRGQIYSGCSRGSSDSPWAEGTLQGQSTNTPEDDYDLVSR